MTHLGDGQTHLPRNQTISDDSEPGGIYTAMTRVWRGVYVRGLLKGKAPPSASKFL